jgi:hypothetical protein
MGWKSVPICDDHWVEEEGSRQALRIIESLRDRDERCYRCGRQADGIYVRRNIPDEAGRINVGCARCGKEVSGNTTSEAAVIVLGMTYDDVAVCIAFHGDCMKEVERVYVPPRVSDGLSLIDAVYANEQSDLIEGEADYLSSQRDRREDV